MSIDRTSPISMYVQLAEALKSRIVRSGLGIGGRLPTVRELIVEYGVSLPVVRQAMSLLAKEGILAIEQGKGTFVLRVPVLAPTSGDGAVLFLSIARPSSDPFFAHVLAGFERAAAAAGTPVLFGQSAADARTAMTVIRNRGTRSVALSGDIPGELVDQLASGGISFVCAGIPHQPEPPSGVSFVANDDFGGAYQATQHLLAMGHRRIGHVGGDTTAFFWRQRHAGYLQALAHAGIAADPALHAVATADDSEHGATASARLLALPEPPTAIFAANDRLARGCYREVRERGLAIPADLSVVGFDDLGFASELHPSLTTIHAEMESLGAAAYTLLGEAMAGGPPRQITLPVRLVQRDSTAPRR